ncbi:MAG TPA: cation:dicarboxylase symporter family transporter [Microbacterium sp.]|nr:cation:dicarboxylase symporter family transporter [Microbacterium sp.]
MAKTPTAAPRKKKRGVGKEHWLYIAVIIAVVAGIAVGILAPEFGASLAWIGKGFVNLIKMMIAPVIFCTIVLGIGSIAKAATVGKVGGLALGYFLVMSTFALVIGLVVGNFIHPGEGLDLSGANYEASGEGESEDNFLLSIIPTTLLSPLTGESVLQVLFVALLVGFAIQQMGSRGEPILEGIRHIQAVVFRVLTMVLWIAPIGAFGAIAGVVGETGWEAVGALAVLMVAFYLTCIVFIGVVLAAVLWFAARVNIFSLMKYLAREYLLIVSTSSSESALPRLIAKMEHVGVSKPVAGITIPTGYSFNLDGTAIYLTMASLFIATAMGTPLTIPEQIGLLVFMIIASKGAAGVSGAGLATLAGGLQTYRPDMVDGVGMITGIDRFMSEARALTNFTGNAVASIVIGTWTKEFDRERALSVLSGEVPFDEKSMVDDGHGPADPVDEYEEQMSGSDLPELPADGDGPSPLSQSVRTHAQK